MQSDKLPLGMAVGDVRPTKPERNIASAKHVDVRYEVLF
jgi:hypothetical protein